VVSLGLPDWGILCAIYLLYLVLGCFFDGTSLLLVSLPLVQPLVSHLGVDIIWFGVIATILIEIGMITPPVGMNLFVIMSVCEVTLSQSVRSSVPFFFIMLAFVGLFTAFPQIVTFLPNMILGH
jgi:C4-dicarboxylate transporter DctM subunit